MTKRILIALRFQTLSLRLVQSRMPDRRGIYLYTTADKLVCKIAINAMSYPKTEFISKWKIMLCNYIININTSIENAHWLNLKRVLQK